MSRSWRSSSTSIARRHRSQLPPAATWTLWLLVSCDPCRARSTGMFHPGSLTLRGADRARQAHGQVISASTAAAMVRRADAPVCSADVVDAAEGGDVLQRTGGRTQRGVDADEAPTQDGEVEV